MCVFAEFCKLDLVERIMLLKQLVLGLSRLFGDVPISRRVLRYDGFRLVGLKLCAIATRLRRSVDVAFCSIYGRYSLNLRSVVEIDTHLGNQIRDRGSHFAPSFAWTQLKGCLLGP